MKSYKRRQTIGLIGILALLAVIISLPCWAPATSPPPFPFSRGDAGIIVKITVSPRRSGIYCLPKGANRQDLLRAAGYGKLDVSAIPTTTLEQKLHSGESILVEISKKDGRALVVQSTSMDNAECLALGLPIDINMASLEDLILLQGIGEKTAQAIIEYRQKKGSLQKIEELREIQGIGAKRLAILHKQVFVGKRLS